MDQKKATGRGKEVKVCVERAGCFFFFSKERKGQTGYPILILPFHLIACDACLRPHYLCQMRRSVSRTPR